MPSIEVAVALLAWGLVLLLAAAGRRDAARALRSVPRSTWAVVLVVTLAGAAVRVGTPENWMLTWWEWVPMEQGRAVLLHHENLVCPRTSYGDMMDPVVSTMDPLACNEPQATTVPAGFSSLLALAFAISGVSIPVVQALSLLASILTVPAIFLLCTAALNDRPAGVLAAASLALLPMHVVLAKVPTVASTSILISALAIAAVALAAQARSRVLATLAAVLLVLATSVNTLNVALVIPCLIIIHRARGGLKWESSGPAAVVFLLALVSVLLRFGGLEAVAGPMDIAFPRQPFAWEHDLLGTVHARMTAIACALGIIIAGARRSLPFLSWSLIMAAVFWSMGWTQAPYAHLAAYVALLPVSGVGLAKAAGFLFPEYLDAPANGGG